MSISWMERISDFRYQWLFHNKFRLHPFLNFSYLFVLFPYSYRFWIFDLPFLSARVYLSMYSSTCNRYNCFGVLFSRKISSERLQHLIHYDSHYILKCSTFLCFKITATVTRYVSVYRQRSNYFADWIGEFSFASILKYKYKKQYFYVSFQKFYFIYFFLKMLSHHFPNIAFLQNIDYST